ncbi:MAG: TonB family protein [Prevotella sp.]|nr:TonB family protein [Prevotella sp.]
MRHLFVILAVMMSLLFPQTAMSDPLPDNIVGAQFPGGTEQLIKFLSDNVKYPAECEKQGVQGRVILRIVIDKDGSVTDVEVAKSVHPLLDAEAVRVASSMPRWQPATKDGQPVRIRYSLPINFSLNTPATEKGSENVGQASRDRDATFPGGLEAIRKYLDKNFVRPLECSNIEGNMEVAFIVDEEGKVSMVEVTKSLHPKLDKALTQVFMNMPKWQPAMRDGKPRQMRFTMPLHYFQHEGMVDGEEVYDKKGQLVTMPQFPGGKEKLKEFLSKNVKYPVECEASGITGRVVVGFVVEKDGKVTQVKLDRSSDPAFNMEAYRVMKKMPRWIPGKVGDEPITVKYKLPITFRL